MKYADFHKNEIAHMEMLQAVITRMGKNSFLLKSWSVALVSALFILSEKNANWNFALLSIFPILVFWSLDAYYLYQERLFRELFNQTRKRKTEPFDMSTKSYSSQFSWLKAMGSVSLVLFYGSIEIMIAAGFFLLPVLNK